MQALGKRFSRCVKQPGCFSVMPLRLNHATTIICSSVFKSSKFIVTKSLFSQEQSDTCSPEITIKNPDTFLQWSWHGRKQAALTFLVWNPIELMHATVNLSGKHGNNSHVQGLSHWHYWSWIKNHGMLISIISLIVTSWTKPHPQWTISKAGWIPDRSQI